MIRPRNPEPQKREKDNQNNTPEQLPGMVELDIIKKIIGDPFEFPKVNIDRKTSSG